MDIYNLLLSHPLNGIALLGCLAVIAWSLTILKRSKPRYHRILTGMVGMTGVIQGIRLVLEAAGQPFDSKLMLDGPVNLFVTAIYLASLWILRSLLRSHRHTEYALRLAEGNQSLSFTNRVPLNVTEDFSRVVLDSAPMPMFAIGLDGNVNCWNRAAERALGWTRDEVIGNKLPNLILQPLDPLAMGSDTLRLVHRDGEPLQHEARTVPLRDAKGTVSGILTIITT